MPSTGPPAPLIAVIEDEDHLAQGLLFNLEAEGYRTHHEADGASALAWLLAADPPPAAVLLDVMLPGRDGFSIVKTLREAGRYLPVMLLTARGRTEDIAEGFAAGADDYLPKPFDLVVLLARLGALLRRMHWQSRLPPAAAAGADDSADTTSPAPPPAQTEWHVAGRLIDLASLEIRNDAPPPGASPATTLLGSRTTPSVADRTSTIHLTLMEADLLRYLLERPGKIIPRKELLENVWRVREDTDTRAIDNFIVRLRRYLEPDPANPVHLLSVRGVGYRFLPHPG